MTQQKPSLLQQIADNFSWIGAILFPKKAKPSKMAQAATMSPAAATPNQAPARASQPASKAASTPDAEKRERRLRALWTWGSALSIVLNVILLLVVVVLLNQLFVIKQLVGDQLLGGLYANFVKMDQAHITTEITVSERIPISFDLPISKNIDVELTADTTISNATVVSLNTGGLVIRNAPATIVLPAGTVLPVKLAMTVPVQTEIPIVLKVPVDIPLDQTELHEPFTGLQSVVSPYYWLLKPEWKACTDVPGLSLGGACGLFFSAPSK